MGSNVLECVLNLMLAKAPGTLWTLFKWCSLGVLGGIIVAVIIFFLLKALGAFQWHKKFRKLMLAGVFLVYILALPVLGAFAGLFQGYYEGIYDLFRDSVYSQESLPELGEGGADLMAIMYFAIPEVVEKQEKYEYDKEIMDQRIEAYRKGEWNLNVKEFYAILDDAGGRITREGADRLVTEIQEYYPAFKEEPANTILKWMAKKLCERIVRKAVDGTLETLKIHDPVHAFLDGLEDLGEQQGEADDVTHKEMSIYLVQTTVTTCVLGPVKSIVRGMQIKLLIAAFMVIFLPVIVIHFCKGKKPSEKITSDPAMEEDGGRTDEL